MIIKKEDLKENKDFNLEEHSPFMILDTKHFQYFSDVEKFGYSVEVLNVINSITWINKLYRDLKSDLHIETEIFYEIIDCVLNGRHFNDTQLERYYAAQQKLEHFSSITHKLTDTDNNFDVPFIIDFIILGTNLERYDSLNEDKRGELHDEYAALFCQIRTQEIEIEDFLLQAKALVFSVNEIELENII
ncbi:hypothetical protein GGR22_002585 [Flavobacterium gossypii]|uniref:Uncharacterized protein n=2 Tax=Flavobacterium TaxID=237 RepID=A0A495M169_9FLAO|nr:MULTISPECIES: hypothetical protein [Flavobacterium]MBA9074418.1 hypothetical protein [Flavobacterium gossypii]RKS19178.1 hypothetical protein CLV94_3129 [Flavobacterium endophyticum]